MMLHNPDNKLITRLAQHTDRIKAALIIIVVADHNDWFRQLAPALFEPLTFHVLGFLLLSFTFGEKKLSFKFVADRVARYMVPYWWALTGASLAYFFMFRGDASLSNTLTAWALAAVIGNAPFVKTSSGLLMLWFLPSLFGLTCLLALFNSFKTTHAMQIAVGLAILAHLATPLLSSTWLLWIPFGLAIAANIFILGLIWQRLLNLPLPTLWGPIAIVIFIVSYGTLVVKSVHLEIATFEIVGVENPMVLLLQDISGIAGVLVVIWLVGLPRQVRWLEAIGENSLLIYLIHPVAYVALGIFLPTTPIIGASSIQLFLNGFITTCVAIGFAYAISIAVTRSQFLSKWIIPKSFAQWPPARLIYR